MKLIIAGSRRVKAYAAVEHAIREALRSWGKAAFEVEEVVSGGAKGVDAMGEQWAARRSLRVRVFEARWAEFGKGAGPKRNAEMAAYGDALVAVWDGESPGTADMIGRMTALGRPVHVHRVGAPKERTP